jgi:CHAT domain-containing protein
VAFPDEARAISHRTGGECISGRRLDKETVRDFATRGKVLHFACHGFFDGRSPLDSGLLLSTTTPPRPDDVLSIRDVAEWDLHADLVTLSACETGLGQIVPADFLSLARGFMGVGARSVIASLWPVEDAATQRLMLSFYDDIERQRNAVGTVDIAAALRTAQLAWRDAPLHEWAAFKLIGWPMFEWVASA